MALCSYFLYGDMKYYCQFEVTVGALLKRVLKCDPKHQLYSDILGDNSILDIYLRSFKSEKNYLSWVEGGDDGEVDKEVFLKNYTNMLYSGSESIASAFDMMSRGFC